MENVCLTTYVQVTVRVRDGKKLAHEGIKVEFVGSIGVFLSLARESGALNPRLQSCSMTADIIMNFCRYHKS